MLATMTLPAQHEVHTAAKGQRALAAHLADDSVTIGPVGYGLAQLPHQGQAGCVRPAAHFSLRHLFKVLPHGQINAFWHTYGPQMGRIRYRFGVTWGRAFRNRLFLLIFRGVWVGMEIPLSAPLSGAEGASSGGNGLSGPATGWAAGPVWS